MKEIKKKPIALCIKSEGNSVCIFEECVLFKSCFGENVIVQSGCNVGDKDEE